MGFGAEILMSKNTFKLLLKNKNKFDFSLPDDVAIGKLLLSLGVTSKFRFENI